MNEQLQEEDSRGFGDPCASGVLRWGLLGVTLLLFLMLQISLFREHRLPYADLETDAFGYLATAQGPWFAVHDYQPPGYPLLMRAVSSLTGLSLFEAGKAVSILSGAIWILSGWFLFQSLLPFPAAVLGTWLLAFQHLVLLYSCAVLSDLLGAAFFLASAAFLLSPKADRLLFAFPGGLAAGAAYFTRYAFILLAVLPVFWCVPLLLQAERRRKGVGGLALFFLGFALVNLPWWIFLHRETGQSFWSKSYLVVAHHVFGEGHPTTFETMAGRFSGMGEVLAADPLRFARVVCGSILDLPRHWDSLDPSFLVLAATGGLAWIVRMDRRKAIFLGVSLLYLALTSMVHFEGRYFIPLLPILMGCVAEGVLVVPDRILKKALPGFWMRDLRNLTLCTLGIGYALHALSYSRDWLEYTVREEEPVEYLAAADWLRANADPAASILAAKPHIAVWAGLRFLSLRQDFGLENLETPDLGAALEGSGADYLVFDQRIASREWPRFEFLLGPKAAESPPGLREVFRIDQPRKVLIYRIVRPPG